MHQRRAEPHTVQPPEIRRARVAATVAFATNGALPATLLARYAEVKELLGVEAGLFGLLIAGYMIGAAAAFQLPGTLLRRFGSRRVTSVGTAWMALALLLAAAGVAAGAPWLFLAGLVVMGLGDATVDVAQNAQGLRVQQVYGRSLLTSMHAGWSVGAATGGAVGIAAATAGVPLVAHLAVWGVVCTVSMVLASRAFLDDGADRGAASGSDDAPARSRLGGRAAWALAPLALVALAGISVEDIGNNWSAVLLATERGVPAATAGIGLSLLLGAQFVGRLIGDRFIDRVGHRSALIISLALVAVGLMLVAWSPTAALTLTGFAVAGIGCAITVPLAFSEADALPGLEAHAGVTWINWIMRVASIGLTPAIGGLATAASLPVAITVIALIPFVALVAMSVQRPARSRPLPHEPGTP